MTPAEDQMDTQYGLLVEDNPDDVALMLRVLGRADIATEDEVVVARDGSEALDYVFATGAYAGRDADLLP